MYSIDPIAALNLRVALDSAEAEIRTLRAMIAAAKKSESGDAGRGVRKALVKYTEMFEEKERENIKLRADYDASKTANNALRKINTNLNEAVELLEKQLREERKELRARCAAAEDDMERWKRSAEARKANVQDLHEERKELRARCAAAEEWRRSAEAWKADLRRLQEIHEKTLDERESLQRELRAAKMQQHEVEHLTKLREDVEALRREGKCLAFQEAIEALTELRDEEEQQG